MSSLVSRLLPSSVRVAHIAKSSHNIGEGALISGLHNFLRSQYSSINFTFNCIDRKYFQSVHGKEFSKNSTTLFFDHDFVSYINQNYDLLVIGGGGIIQTGYYQNVGGLVLAGDLQAFHKLTIPWVVYGAGDNRFNSQLPFHYVDNFCELVDIAISSNLGSVSVRNDLSWDRLLQIVPASTMSHVSRVPDSGLYIPTCTNPIFTTNPHNRNIALQLAGDRIPLRIPGSDSSECLNSFFQQLAQALLDLYAEEPFQLHLIPHIPADFHLIVKFIEFCDQYRIGNSSMVREIFNFYHCSKGLENAVQFFGIYSQCDLAIGMRGHAGICSTGLRTPFINIESHPKTSGFMEEMNLSQYSLNPSSPNFQSQLTSLSNALLKNPLNWLSMRDCSFSNSTATTSKFHDSILLPIHTA